MTKLKILIENALEERVKISPIKRWTVRYRNALKKPDIRQPTVFFVRGSSGKNYKLLHSPARSVLEIERISTLHQKIGGVVSAPKIIWMDPSNILAEFIEGDFSDLTDKSMLSQLGENFGLMHKFSSVEKSTVKIVEDRMSDLEYLCKKKLIDRHLETKASSFIEKFMPNKLLFGLSYTDHNTSNFVTDHNGRLHLIDLGSFQENVPLDQHLAISGLKVVLDSPYFCEPYLAAGGKKIIFENKNLFFVVNQVKSMADNAKILESDWWGDGLGRLVPHLDFRLVRARKKNITTLQSRLRNFFS